MAKRKPKGNLVVFWKNTAEYYQKAWKGSTKALAGAREEVDLWKTLAGWALTAAAGLAVAVAYLLH